MTLLLKALRCENHTGKTPIWLMRQAGRYLPEYRAIRANHSFRTMYSTPELVAEITELPIKLLGFDAAILFSDILVITDTLGRPFDYEEGIGPVLRNPLQTDTDIDSLVERDVAETLHFVAQGIKLLRSSLSTPLIGFCGAPFTVASYLIEGRSSHDFKKTKQWMLRHPDRFHQLLQLLTKQSIEYLKMQIQAGVQAIQLFDSWAHILGPTQFREFSLSYMQQLMKGVGSQTPIILFCKGSSLMAEQLATLKPAAISLDWQGDIGAIRRIVPYPIALQGNLDPDLLYGDAKTIRKEAQRILNAMRDDSGHIFNLGHGIHPDIPVDAVKTLIACVRESTR